MTTTDEPGIDPATARRIARDYLRRYDNTAADQTADADERVMAAERAAAIDWALDAMALPNPHHHLALHDWYADLAGRLVDAEPDDRFGVSQRINAVGWLIMLTEHR